MQENPFPPTRNLRRIRTNLVLAALAAASILVPYLFWQGTWFGRPLTDEEMQQYLTDTAKPRHIQHALIQIGERIARGDASVRHWYPQLAPLSDSNIPELRVTLAWVLGADNHEPAFHDTLKKLLADTEPMVRRNAALSLVRFGDVSGRDEIVRILRPYSLRAPAAGTVHFRAKEGAPVSWNAILVQVSRSPNNDVVDVHSPVPGTVGRRLIEEGAQCSQGAELLSVTPEETSAWEALRALYLIGQPEDVPAINAYLATNPDASEKIRTQAADTIAGIRRRAQPGDPESR